MQSKKIAPYLVLISLLLNSCTNREILHGSSSDKPPSLKMAKKLSTTHKENADVVSPDTKSAETKSADAKSEDAKSEENETAQKSETVTADAEATADSPAEKPKEKRLRVWFARENKGGVQPYGVEREIDKKEPLRSAVSQLLEGPTESERKSGVKSEVPAGITLISLKKKGDVVELNLSKEFSSGGVDSIETRLQQLKLTIKEVAGHDKVYLDIEGKRLTSAGDGLEVKQPLNL